MAASPAAMICLAAGTVQLVARLEWSPRILRYEAWTGRAAVAGMTAFLGGALCWVSQNGPSQAPFRAGNIDAAGIGVMAIALAVGSRAISRAAPRAAAPR